MARFLVDESLPRAASRALSADGHDVEDVRDVGLRGRPDVEVMARARSESRIVASADTDFANTLTFPPGSHPGVVVLRVPGDWNAERRASRLLSGIIEVGLEDLTGALVIVEPSRSRVYSAGEADQR